MYTSRPRSPSPPLTFSPFVSIHQNVEEKGGARSTGHPAKQGAPTSEEKNIFSSVYVYLLYGHRVVRLFSVGDPLSSVLSVSD